MPEGSLAPLRTWLAAPLDPAVSDAIVRLRRAPDVQHIAVMPDVHLSSDVCIGVALATSSLIYPQAVGGDIGCGMLAIGLDRDASALDESAAARVMAGLARLIPARRRNRNQLVPQPDDLIDAPLSHPTLESIRRADGTLEFATLGSGNHFIELQADEQDRLWLMVHSGSRALGQAILRHHLPRAQPSGNQLRAFDANSPQGTAYLLDVSHARSYAAASRHAIAQQVGAVLAPTLGANLCWDTAIATDHNHVALETHSGRPLWVHRKGAMSAKAGEPGVLPGSMGTLSFHVEGRGEQEALCSSAHGAGRALTRAAAHAQVTERDLRRQMEGVWFNSRLARKLRDEAPSAYKDIRAVLRAQNKLVKLTRTLRPILNYKGI